MSAFTKAVENGLTGLEHVSVGYMSYEKCGDCPIGGDESDCGDEGHFSWSACDCCGSSLGGTRYAAHGLDSEGNIVHLDVCVDCLQFIANGEEPENWQNC